MFKLYHTDRCKPGILLIQGEMEMDALHLLIIVALLVLLVGLCLVKV